MDFTDEQLAELTAGTFGDLLFDARESEADHGLSLLKRIVALLELRPGDDSTLTDRTHDLHISEAYNELASAYSRAYEMNDAIRYYRLAIAAASKSKSARELYRAWHGLGMCHVAQDDYSQALREFQQSMAFAHHSSRLDAIVTLEWVAVCWQHDPATIGHAAALYDWICLLQPTWIRMYIEKYRCLADSGAVTDVEDVAAQTSSTDFVAIANSLAANVALGRTRRAKNIARLGLKYADTVKDTLWHNAFAGILD